jgi:predicted TIM-barrel fold metal-dependent hydrolase
MDLNILDIDSLFGFWPLRKADLSVEALVATIQQQNVKRALALSTTGIFTDYQRGNEETVQVCQKVPELFPAATVDPRRYVGCLEEIDRRVGQGIKLFRLFPEYQNWPLDFAPFRRILGKLAERKAVAMIDAGPLGHPTKLAALTKDLGLTLLLAAVPAAGLGELLVVLEEHPNVYVETRLLNSPQAIELLVGQSGAERLVFGSGTPLYYFSSALMPLQAANLTDAQKAQILGDNLRRLLS